MMIILLIGIVFIFYYFGNGNRIQNRFSESTLSPEEILASRFAKGEIDSETYENMKRTLKQ